MFNNSPVWLSIPIHMKSALCVISFIFSIAVHAAHDRADYDLDNNGLIEINDLADLNEIRNNLDGKTLYGSNAGCPTINGGCKGFELMTPLDFDTNQDNQMDSSDTYWNNGLGWNPIGTYEYQFTAIFEGNGHVIRNLFIDKPNSSYIGLFGVINGSEVRNLVLTGQLMHLRGRSIIGAIAGKAYNSSIGNVFNTGPIYGNSRRDWNRVGGIIGELHQSNLVNVFNSGAVEGTDLIGGLVGRAYSSGDDFIRNGLNVGLVSGIGNTGGIGGRLDGTDILNNYWASDAVGQVNSFPNIIFWTTEVSLTALQCAIESNTNSENSNCVSDDGSEEGRPNPITLFRDWDNTFYDGKVWWEGGVWDYGNDTQLPGMVFNGVIYRDSDADGALDSEDTWPLNPAASQDSDSDGFPDVWSLICDVECIASSGLKLDQFPQNPDVWQDEDLDGLPDSWGPDCDADCQNESSLALDTHINDSDNDGILNHIDSDHNNDGISDADADGDGLLEIDTLAELNAVRYQLDGAGLRMVNDGEIDISGCPLVIHKGVLAQRCHGYELNTDLDFDTNQDRLMDANDTYWNAGYGWLAISGFTAIFEGNGHVISNLFIDRLDSSDIGLFGSISNSEVRNLGLTGPLMKIRGSSGVGSLAGSATFTEIKNVFNTGPIEGESSAVGGIIGLIFGSGLANVVSSGVIRGSGSAGGLIGYVDSSESWSVSRVKNGLNVGLVVGGSNSGGLIGYVRGNTDGNHYSVFENSYWAVDVTGQVSSAGESEANSYVGLPIDTLQCAVQANTHPSISSCVSVDGSDEGLMGPLTLFNEWDKALLHDQSLWDFGSSSEVPSLVFNGKSHRDTDGDGVEDLEDRFPLDSAASMDVDEDGFPDMWHPNCDAVCIAGSSLHLDQFPLNAVVWQDEDLDGLPDSWANDCNGICQIESGLTLDAYLNDSDNDGVDNPSDTDDNNDGFTDVDINSNGLIEINNLDELNAMRFQLDGNGFRNSIDGELDQSGCPEMIYQGRLVRRCIGYELMTDLDFDTNQDGVIDVEDAYWDDGEGWIAIGDFSNRFSATFDGNGHVIRNLFINRPSSNYQGLFGETFNAEIRNLGLTGPNMDVKGMAYVGALAGYVVSTNIKNIFNTGSIEGEVAYVGGLVGYLDSSQLENVSNSGNVTGYGNVGGVAGLLYSPNKFRFSAVRNALNVGLVTGQYYAGGLVGGNKSDEFTVIENSYWAMDASGQITSVGESNDSSYVGVSLNILKCATQANTNWLNSSCANYYGLNYSVSLFNDWDQIEANGQSLWNYGGSTKIPVLTLNGRVYRDSDGDFIFDADDTYPFISLDGLQDTDYDGIPNTCDSACVESGMEADSDNDNDGVDDMFDPDIGGDNGSPVIVHAPDETLVAVTTEAGDAFEWFLDDGLLNQVVVEDLVDSIFTYEVNYQGVILTQGEDDMMLLPAGYQVVKLVAIDSSGNRSEPVDFVLKVYPRVRFEIDTSVIGENKSSSVKVLLTGDSPEYPVVVDFVINEMSDVNQDDLHETFDILSSHQLMITAGDQEDLNRDGYIQIPIIDDNLSENDELLLIDLLSIRLESEANKEIESLFEIDREYQQHELTVTYQNLAPVVQLRLEQNGVEVTEVIKGKGGVTVTAIIQDGNGNDEHALSWDLKSLGLDMPSGKELIFNPDEIPAGSYSVFVNVTDDGMGSLSGSALIKFNIVEPIVEKEGAASGAGGALAPWFMIFLIFGMLARVARKPRQMNGIA